MEWWMYAITAIAVFSCCLFLNYIVKKINEADLEERLRGNAAIEMSCRSSDASPRKWNEGTFEHITKKFSCHQIKPN
ncbi:hypothetical protein evm_000159 [Chilo suppressalis]|nr:hypothetical protein evm_000159 [Chilo suppressalis]